MDALARDGARWVETVAEGRADRVLEWLQVALGVGLASSVEGRNPVVDGFGLIAFASLTPIIFVMLYGMLI